jgi:hypothetical protein
MWKFCLAVLNQEVKRSKWQPLLRVYRRLNRLLDVLLGLGVVGGSLYLIYYYVPIATNKRWTVIVSLAAIVTFLAWFITAVKRFHKATVSEVYAAQESITNEYADCANKIESLTLLLGRCDALCFLLENRSWKDNPNTGVPLAIEEIKYHEADLWNTLQDRYGTDVAEDHFGKLGNVPEDLAHQKRRMEAHQSKLHNLRQSERQRQRAIAQKAVQQKQEITKLIESAPNLR